MNEIEEAGSLIQEAISDEGDVIFSMGLDENLDDEVRVTVIATGFDWPAELLDNPPEPVYTAPSEPERPAARFQTAEQQRPFAASTKQQGMPAHEPADTRRANSAYAPATPRPSMFEKTERSMSSREDTSESVLTRTIEEIPGSDNAAPSAKKTAKYDSREREKNDLSFPSFFRSRKN